MSRIDPITKQESGPATRGALAMARRTTKAMTGRETERMIEPLEVFAHAPRILMGYGALELAFGRSRELPERLKQLAQLKAATTVQCEYCIDIGSAIARESGLDDGELLALARYSTSPRFDELDKLVLDFAVAMSRTPAAVSDELFAGLRAHLEEKQLVELAAAVALENFRARFNGALDIGSAGFSEGLVCAAREPVTGTEHERMSPGAAEAREPAAAP